MNYINYHTLSTDIRKLSNKLPRDIDLIAGIPRSGIIPGAMLALLRNVPFVTTTELEQGTIDLASSDRMKSLGSKPIKKVLVIDDSYNTGRQMGWSKEKLKHLPYEFIFAAVYGSQAASMNLDYHQRVISHPRTFEWNIFHNNHVTKACVDIDGVLCHDPAFTERGDNPQQMRDFILNAEPKFLPTPVIRSLVTNRLEKFRPETEQWLAKHNIRYKELIMSSAASPEARRQVGDHGKYKAEMMLKLNSPLFIESSIQQSRRIKEITNRAVFCTDKMEML